MINEKTTTILIVTVFAFALGFTAAIIGDKNITGFGFESLEGNWQVYCQKDTPSIYVCNGGSDENTISNCCASKDVMLYAEWAPTG
jgi:hypothetical protein